MNSHRSSRPERRADALDVLSDQNRRSVLSYLQESSSDVATLEDLVDHISTREVRDDRQLAITLHHVTLPKLAEAGLVEYDPRSNTVRYEGDSEVLELLDEL